MRKNWSALPELIRFMLTHFADGVVLGWSLGLMVIWFDVARIGTLLAHTDSAALTALFFVSGGLVFGTLSASVALMNLRDN